MPEVILVMVKKSLGYRGNNMGFFEWLFGTQKPDLTKMTKVQLEKLGRKHGIELDRRLKKDKLIKQVQKAINKGK